MPTRKPAAGWADIKNALIELDRTQLLVIIKDLYGANAANKRFLHARVLRSADTIEDYRQRVADAVYPSIFSRKGIRLGEANGVIAAYRRSCLAYSAFRDLRRRATIRSLNESGRRRLEANCQLAGCEDADV